MPADRSPSSASLRTRTRAALGQFVGDVLSTQLGALETRLSRSGWLTTRPTGSATGGRLREVLDRDRALLAAEPDDAALTTQEALAAPLPGSTPVEAGSAPVAATSGPVGASSAPAQAVATAPAPMPEDGGADAEHEPIRTRTMARLLAAQGYRARALAIYRALLTECPNDAELQAEIERVRAQPA